MKRRKNPAPCDLSTLFEKISKFKSSMIVVRGNELLIYCDLKQLEKICEVVDECNYRIYQVGPAKKLKMAVVIIKYKE